MTARSETFGSSIHCCGKNFHAILTAFIIDLEPLPTEQRNAFRSTPCLAEIPGFDAYTDLRKFLDRSVFYLRPRSRQQL
jgi:hypothetical protein